MKIFLVAVTVLSVFQLGYGNYPVNEEISSSISFSLELYQNLFEHNNTVFSPLSFRVLLSLLYQGAIHETSDDIREKLHLSSDKVETYRTQKQNFDRIFASSNINLANKIYIREGSELRTEFANVVRDFNSDIEQVNFQNSNEVAANINQWVVQKTNGLIRDLVSPSMITSNTALLLLNSIHFKAKWAKPFSLNAIISYSFYGRDQIKPIDFIVDLDHYKVARGRSNLNADVLEMPYETDSNFVLWIILPHESNDIQQVANSLTEPIIQRINNTFVKGRTDIMVPMFEIETCLDAVELLTEFGIGSLFENTELDLLENGNLLKVDAVRQKTKITVNTDGTEAATSTFLKATPRRAYPRFKVNRPFIFGVFTADKLEPVFLGHYINPV